MLRPLWIIVWAIGFSKPSMPQHQRASYAKVIRSEARDHQIDPFTLVSIIHHESRWRSNVISPDGEDVGLAQIRARYLKGCRGDKDPVNKPSASCRAAKARLKSGAYNIRVMAGAITRWRKLCRKKTGRPALFHRWLHGYGGKTNIKRGLWCNQRRTRGKWRDLPVHPKLRRIINYRRKLVRLSKRQRRKR